MRKAFMDLNHEKTGTISKQELKFFLKYWGLEMSDEEFVKIFSRFDLDGDGKISYKDF
jgi:Ca2+-binding EF-hand superfamily protein